MKISSKRLIEIIREEVEYALQAANPSEVEPIADAWAGGENLILPLDHSKAGGSEAVTAEQEFLKITSESRRLSSKKLRSFILSEIIEDETEIVTQPTKTALAMQSAGELAGHAAAFKAARVAGKTGAGKAAERGLVAALAKAGIKATPVLGQLISLGFVLWEAGSLVGDISELKSALQPVGIDMTDIGFEEDLDVSPVESLPLEEKADLNDAILSFIRDAVDLVGNAIVALDPEPITSAIVLAAMAIHPERIMLEFQTMKDEHPRLAGVLHWLTGQALIKTIPGISDPEIAMSNLARLYQASKVSDADVLMAQTGVEEPEAVVDVSPVEDPLSIA